jgi:serine/threonine protein kinase
MHKNNIPNEISFSEALELIEKECVELENIEPFLKNRYQLSNSFINSIKEIVKVNDKKINIAASDVVGQAAELAATDFDPESYVDKVFGEYRSTNVIYATDKSIILVGRPESNRYSDNVAIKIHSPAHKFKAGDESIPMQAQYMANIKHPNIVEIKGSGTTNDGIDYVVMEYLPGHNVAEYCNNNNLSINERLNIFLRICAAISKMHTLLLIHSDLKPQNVIMDVNQRPKIIDFELSLSHSKSLHENFNYKNINGCTEGYAAPEQENNKTNPTEVSALTDIYGLSQILFEILTGAPLFNCKVSITEAIKQNIGKIPRIEELALVITKGTSINPEKRHQSANEVMNDIRNIIHGDNISLSYKKHASLIYKAKFYVLKRKLLLFFVALLAFIISMSGWAIIQERNAARESLQMVMESNDPRVIDNNVHMDKLADEAYKNDGYNTKDYYDKLMGWGQAYYGKGQAKKSIKYFSKAQSLYPDLNSDERISSTTSLLSAYFNLGLKEKYKELIDPYEQSLKNPVIENPYMIEMFLVISEIKNKYFSNVIDFELNDSTIDILERLKIENVKDTELKTNLTIRTLIYKATSLYYSLPSDWVSVLSYVSDEEYKKTIEPSIKKCIKYLEQAIKVLRDNDTQSHLEARIYNWLGYLKFEMQDVTSGQAYFELAKNRTLSIFGENHPRLTEIYIKEYGAHRYVDPKAALIAAKKAHESYSLRTSSDSDIQFITHNYLIISYLTMGDLKGAMQAYKHSKEKFLNISKISNKNNKNIALEIAYSGLDFSLYSYLNHKFVFDPMLVTAELEIGDAYGLNVNDTNPGWSKLVFSYVNNQDDIAMLVESYENYMMTSGNADDDILSSEFLWLAQICYQSKECPYLKYAKSSEKLMKWSEFDKEFSVEKLSAISQLAYYYTQAGEYDVANDFLEEVKPILEKQVDDKSFHVSYWNRIKAQIEYKKGNTQKASEFKRKAMIGAVYNLGVDASFTKELSSLN